MLKFTMTWDAMRKRMKANGYPTTRIRAEKLIGESALIRLRSGQPVSWDTIEQLCSLMDCQPGDLLEYIPDEDQGNM